MTSFQMTIALIWVGSAVTALLIWWILTGNWSCVAVGYLVVGGIIGYLDSRAD